MQARDNRIELTMEADVSDGTHVFDGAVGNVSRKGFLLQDIPKQFNFYSSKCMVVVKNEEKSFKLLIKPRWSKAHGERKNIGFQIISPPLNWLKFFNELDDGELAVSVTLH